LCACRDLALTCAPGNRSVRFILHHLADAETVLYDRIRRVLSEPRQVLWVFDQDAWAKGLDCSHVPLSVSRQVYESVRSAVIYHAGRHSETMERRSAIRGPNLGAAAHHARRQRPQRVALTRAAACGRTAAYRQPVRARYRGGSPARHGPLRSGAGRTGDSVVSAALAGQRPIARGFRREAPQMAASQAVQRRRRVRSSASSAASAAIRSL
jgi:hypothetical protein